MFWMKYNELIWLALESKRRIADLCIGMENIWWPRLSNAPAINEEKDYSLILEAA